eukprot:TRINITY_DN2735_c0_g1_i1.p1 TRINITY_DN2735_c0_g1~~TRINITY_DN2735_c0_g1_i1.p1  ORF type:complete len:257 (+),score=61.56 TRINITY_DN2735_c0_g1_i1:86-856(+)
MLRAGMPDIVASCDIVSKIILVALCLVGLLVAFFGYRIYKLAFSFVAFLAAAAVNAWIGFLWISEAAGEEVAKRMIVIFSSVFWGVMVAVMCRRHLAIIDKLLGFVLAAAVGAGLVVGLTYVLKQELDDLFGPAYHGWGIYASITLGLPIAYLTGCLFRHYVKHLILLATAIVGSATAVLSIQTLLICSEVPTNTTPKVTALAVASSAFLCFLVQLFCQWKIRDSSSKSRPAEAKNGDDRMHVQPEAEKDDKDDMV